MKEQWLNARLPVTRQPQLIDELEDVYRAVIGGDQERRRVEVEGETLNLGRLRSATQLSQPLTGASVPHAHQCAAFGGSGEARAVRIEREAREGGLVGGDQRRPTDVEELDAQVTLLLAGAGEHAQP